MSDNQTVSTTFSFELDGDQAVLRAVNSLTKSERDLKSQAEAANRELENITKSQAAFRTVQTHIKTLGTNIEKTTELAEGLEGAISELKRQEAVLSLARHFANAADEMGGAREQGEALLATLRQIGATGAEIDRASAAFKAYTSEKSGAGLGVDTLDRGIGAVERFAGSLGNSQVNQIAGIAGDALGTGQALAGVGAGLSSVLAVAAPVAAALGAVAIVTKLVTQAAEAQAEAERKALELRKANLDLELRNVVETRTLSSKDLDQRIKDQTEQVAIVFDAIADRNKELQDKVLSGLQPEIREDPAYEFFRQSRFENARANDEFIQSQIVQFNQLKIAIDNDTKVLKPAIEAREQSEKAEKAANDATRARITDLQKQAASEVQVQNLIRTSTADSVKSRIAQIQDEYTSTQNLIEKLKAVPDTTGQTATEIETLEQKLRDLKGEGVQLVDVVLPLVTAREQETEAAKKQAEALNQATRAADEHAQNVRKLADLEEQQAGIIEKRARDDSRTAQISALESQITAAKEIETEQTRAAKITSLREKAAATEIASARKVSDEIAKVNTSYVESELKAIAAYRQQELRAGAKHNLDRARQLEDLYDTLSETAAKGDVAAFIRSSREGTKQITRGDQDFDIDSRQRAEDFEEEQRQRLAERDARVKELRDSFAAERAERQQQLREQLAQEISAGQQRVLKSVELQNQLTALREQFAQEDLARTRAAEDKAIAEQIAAVKRRNDELKPILTKFLDPATASVKGFATSVANSLTDMYNRVRAAAAGAGRPRIGGPQPLTLNALGGLYTQPTIAGLGELPGYGDAVIPFRQSEGVLPALQKLLAASGGADDGPPVNVYLTTGSVATQEDLKRVTDGVTRAVRAARGRKRGK